MGAPFRVPHPARKQEFHYAAAAHLASDIEAHGIPASGRGVRLHDTAEQAMAAARLDQASIGDTLAHWIVNSPQVAVDGVHASQLRRVS